ncbi:unnamed protein product [Didymodactylos carnosus]|uniref:Uncharacterized protein n=1 Tax=Didymodactylos carnosus TaxID=1234261 RepID=A0A814NX08_9BILA|nr:unnamed protein product [Didymodactylos carnosus]CAF1527957.1 unnamed protein product [Didymodactylos carnosus]CAF3863581.1 unnamed protein product [Didymodactylos carnosus]CAF4314604.1 unnamed protein product [Didymodactylos carnosus]
MATNSHHHHPLQQQEQPFVVLQTCTSSQYQYDRPTTGVSPPPPHYQTLAGTSYQQYYQTLAVQPQGAPSPPLPFFGPEQQQSVRPAKDSPPPAPSSVQ